jgi:hypothetical protein
LLLRIKTRETFPFSQYLFQRSGKKFFFRFFHSLLLLAPLLHFQPIWHCFNLNFSIIYKQHLKLSFCFFSPVIVFIFLQVFTFFQRLCRRWRGRRSGIEGLEIEKVSQFPAKPKKIPELMGFWIVSVCVPNLILYKPWPNFEMMGGKFAFSDTFWAGRRGKGEDVH